MTGFSAATVSSAAIIDAFYLCLVASFIWAPIVFIGAQLLNRRTGGADAAIWPAALCVAALPAIAAPLAAALGFSLRGSKPLPPMSAPQGVAVEAPAEMMFAAEAGPLIDVAMVLNAAADLYFYGFVLFTALGVMRLVGFSYKVRYSEPVANEKIADGLNDWRRAIGVRTPMRYAYCDAVSSVCVHGFIRPVILMPPSLLEYTTTSDAVLMGAHEIAHVKRGDTWLFALCGLTKALFWFNPFMGRIIAHAQLAAEQAADALVIRNGASRASYARCFVDSLKLSSDLAASERTLVPSFTPFDKRSRRARLDAILSGKAAAPALTLGGKITLIASGSLALVIAFGQAAFAVAPPPAKDALTVVPVEGRVTSTYGERLHPVTKEPKFHTGIDIAAPTGTPVRAAGAGKVIAATARYNGSEAWGNIVVIDHGHGLATRYAQLDSYRVQQGDSIKAGETIGAVGATGKFATGPHLHFEILLDGENIDPAPIIVPDAPSAPTHRTKRKAMIAPAASNALLPEPAAPVRGTRILIDTPPDPKPAPEVDVAARAIPDPLPAPDVNSAPEAPIPDELSFGERFELRLAGKFDEFNAHFDEDFRDIIPFDRIDDVVDIESYLDEIETQALASAEAAMDALHDRGFDVENWEEFEVGLPNFAFSFSDTELSERDRAEIEKARATAERAIQKAQRHAQRQIARAQRQMERQKNSRERMDLEFKREELIRDKAMRERQRDDAEAFRDMLEAREEALREAETELARERDELERLHAELALENLNKD